MVRMVNRLKRVYRRYVWSCLKEARHAGVKIGTDTEVATRNFSSEPYLIEIGNHSYIGYQVSFLPHGGLRSQRKKHPGLDFFGKIKVGDYTYIGEGVKILAGVTIGNDVIVGAGSVVTKSIPDGAIAGGNPARVIGQTADFVERAKHSSLASYGMSAAEKRKYLLSLDDSKFIEK